MRRLLRAYALGAGVVLALSGGGLCHVMASAGPVPLVRVLFTPHQRAVVVEGTWRPLPVGGDAEAGLAVMLPDVRVRVDGIDGAVPLLGLAPSIRYPGEAAPDLHPAVGSSLEVILDGGAAAARPAMWRSRAILGTGVGIVLIGLALGAFRLSWGLRGQKDRPPPPMPPLRRIGR